MHSSGSHYLLLTTTKINKNKRKKEREKKKRSKNLKTNKIFHLVQISIYFVCINKFMSTFDLKDSRRRRKKKDKTFTN